MIVQHYWSMGQVVVEVLDADRFNEDVFLGEVCNYRIKIQT
jgi:hypothetical protein